MEDIESLLRSAIRAHEQGRGNQALQLYREVLQRAPEHSGALYRLAMLAFQAGRPDECAPILEKALEVEPDNAEFRFRLGHVLGHMGRSVDAIRHLEIASKLAPDTVEVQIHLGLQHLRSNSRENALMAFQRAVIIEPRLKAKLDDPQLPADLRTGIGTALNLLNEKFKSFADETLERVGSRYPGADLARLEAGVRELSEGRGRSYSNPERRPALLNFPDMPDRPWFEPSEFAWAQSVEDAAAQILDELRALVANDAGFEPYCGEAGSNDVASAAGSDFSSLAGSMSWNALHLYQTSYRLEENCTRCPHTASLVSTLPMPQIRNQSPELFFSCLQPGGHIIPHYGLMNVRLTVHLGLVIPEDCGIRAGQETRTWETGRLLVFDDSYEHEAWNRGTSDRVVLIFEAWNPDLSEAEIAGIEQLFELRRNWLDQFDAQKAASVLSRN